MAEDAPTIEDYYREDRTFPPSAEFVASANLSDPAIYRRAASDPPAFWAEQARELLDWDTDFHTALEWDLPDARWFVGGASQRHRTTASTVTSRPVGAIVWRSTGRASPGDTRTITYSDLLADVQRFANVLRWLGVEQGDRVVIYMPMIPETVVAMLACTRIGAAHSLVFGGFSPDSLTDRINDAGAVVAITADAGYRRGAPSPLKPNLDVALADCPTLRSVVVVDRCGTDVAMTDGRDHWWDDVMSTADPVCAPVAVDSEQLLYLLYTSGTTAKPKGIMHTTGGYLTQAAWTHKEVFDLKADTDVYWCAADVGWVTGHSYIVYGPLANGATSVMYEGTPDTPRESSAPTIRPPGPRTASGT